MEENRASIIIPVHNRLAWALACIESVKRQSYENKEILVIDDGSDAGVYEALSAVSDIRLIRCPESGGPGAARNTGVLESTGNYLVFLDSDCWAPDSEWLAHHMAFHREHSESIVTGYVEGVHDTYSGRAFSYLNWFVLMRQKSGACMQSYIPMADVSMPRSVFDRVGKFDADLRVLEDADWSYRARETGLSIYMHRGAWVYHHDRQGTWTIWQHQESFGRHVIMLHRKHPAYPYGWVYPKTLAGAILKYVPLVCLLSLYIVIAAFTKSPRVLYYIPGIVWGLMGYCWGIIQYFWAHPGRDCLTAENGVGQDETAGSAPEL